ncbi:CsgE family curli-type amyloid fiber assembly protein [Halomonas sp. GFAJ-1]|uniref:CsgE family curli-type amyloid fiber assembly protein n=1 Tax=Halomonas sp. GFAJ-1 TaxID=1118153 RepID=UPI00023A471E|nr:CsgE family curli-type amyloid fiber assembly protein [Halomonas sp. GFAJ-1]AVI61903.1 curli production assembly protein CsgE [Halomonas sp. GFAJ-1]EHK59754.1 curli assembly protein CsgE [Halomonas sp. GFAJ-1]
MKPLNFKQLLLTATAMLIWSGGTAYAEVLNDGYSPGQQEQTEVENINQLSSQDGPVIEQRSNGSGSSELTGVMVDRTITMAGKTFYRAFSQRAMDNLMIGNSTLTIHERPDARWGSQVWIMDGNRMHFRTQLSPRINDASNTAGEAVQIVEEALLRHQLTSALTSDRDLGREEIF